MYFTWLTFLSQRYAPLALVVLHDADTVQVLAPSAMVQLAGVRASEPLTGFASEHDAVVPPLDPVQDHVQELAPSVPFALVPAAQV